MTGLGSGTSEPRKQGRASSSGNGLLSGAEGRARAGREPISATTGSGMPSHQPNDRLIYLYGVVEAGSAAHRRLVAGDVPGLDRRWPLFPIQVDDLVAAVSEVPAAVFQEDPLNELVRDLKQLTPFVVAHQEAIAALLPGAAALVPLAFGAVFRDRSRVTALVGEQADRLRSLLAWLRDRQEWGLKAFVQLRLLRATVETTSEQVRRLDEQLAAAGPGRAYLLRKTRERVVESEAERLLGKWLDSIIEPLRCVSAAMQTDPLPSDPTSARSADGEKLVLKAAFLVDQVRVADFLRLGEEQAARFAERGVRLERSGPWAAYSFARIDRQGQG